MPAPSSAGRVSTEQQRKFAGHGRNKLVGYGYPGTIMLSRPSLWGHSASTGCLGSHDVGARLLANQLPLMT